MNNATEQLIWTVSYYSPIDGDRDDSLQVVEIDAPTAKDAAERATRGRAVDPAYGVVVEGERGSVFEFELSKLVDFRRRFLTVQHEQPWAN